MGLFTFSGFPSAVTMAEDLGFSGQEAVQDALNEAAAELVAMARERARRTPQWEGVADEITAWVEDGDLVLGVPPEAEGFQDAFLAEFGTAEEAPYPVVAAVSVEALRFIPRYVEAVLERRFS